MRKSILNKKRKAIEILIGAVLGLLLLGAIRHFGLLTPVGIVYLTIVGSLLSKAASMLIPEFLEKWVKQYRGLCLAATLVIICGFVGASATESLKTGGQSLESVVSASPEVMTASEPESPPDRSPNPTETTEKQSFLSTERLDTEAELHGTYVPALDETTYYYVFIDEYQNVDGSLSDMEINEIVREKFIISYQCNDNFPANDVYNLPDVVAMISEAEKIDLQIKTALGVNEPVLEYYNELAGLYSKVVQAAPRGQYFLQLGRPYAEMILYCSRETTGEKDGVFFNGALGINAYRTALTYKGSYGESCADLLYRIAAVYHYLGDTPLLASDYRLHLYRLAVAYLSLAETYESESDDYYGYIAYYKAMVMHKLAIVDSNVDEKKIYLNEAKVGYQTAVEQRKFNHSTLDEVNHAICDVEYRLKLLAASAPSPRIEIVPLSH